MSNNCDTFTKSVNFISNSFFTGLISKIEKVEDDILGDRFYFFHLCENHKIMSEKNKTKVVYRINNSNREIYVDEVYTTFKKYFGGSLNFMILSNIGNLDETYILH